jgi:hypothetical protein
MGYSCVERSDSAEDSREGRKELVTTQLRSSDIEITDIRHEFEEYRYMSSLSVWWKNRRSGHIAERPRRVKARSGGEAMGFGSMPLGNAWSFPSSVVRYDQSLKQ